MNKDQFEKYMASSGVTDEKSILELKEVLDKFPYFQIARMLYTRSLYLTNSIHFESNLKKTAAYLKSLRRSLLKKKKP